MARRKSLWFRYGGKPRRGWYKGIWCDSSWELAFVMWSLDHGKEIVRVTERFSYPFRNGVRYYAPDFLVDGEYYEVKGVMDNRSKTKLANFPYPIRVVGKAEIAPFIEYATFKYGENYWELMESPDSGKERFDADTV